MTIEVQRNLQFTKFVDTTAGIDFPNWIVAPSGLVPVITGVFGTWDDPGVGASMFLTGHTTTTIRFKALLEVATPGTFPHVAFDPGIRYDGDNAIDLHIIAQEGAETVFIVSGYFADPL